jgi:all-trans-retinol 13,14-reductase
MSRYDAVVVGAGMAGLTAAAYLRRGGRSVLLLEQNRVCGGLVNSFERGGFGWDGGVRALIDGGILTPMLRDLDIDLPMVRSRVSIGLEDRVMHVEDEGSLADYRRLLLGSFPDHEADIDRILDLVRAVMADMDVLYGVENPTFHDVAREPRYLVGTLMPWSLRFLRTVRRIYAQAAPYERTLAGLTDNPSLADMVGQHFFRGTPTFFAMSYFSLFLDYRYPLGGTGALAKAVEAYNRAQGTVIHTDTRVVAVDPVARQVRDEAGNAWTYGTLIWAADLKTLYGLTREDQLPSARARRRYRALKPRLLERPGGDSVVTLYLGCDRPPEHFAAIAHGHFFYTPVPTGLGDTHRGELSALIRRLRGGAIPGREDRKRAVKGWLDRFFALNSYEISIPVLRDPSMAPPGHTGLIVSVLFEHELCAVVAEDGWYEEFRTYAGDRMLQVLSSSIYPGLREHVVQRFEASPLTLERHTLNHGGAITGWTFEGGPPPVVHRIHQAHSAVRTPFPDILQAGQWTYSPSGVPIAILTGKLAADAAQRDS